MKRTIVALRDRGTVGLVILAAAAACGHRAPAGAAGHTDPLIRNANTSSGSKASGTFSPVGPPSGPAVRIDAGGHCVIDLRQAYSVSGSMSGSFEIDFRILTYGPCPLDPPAAGRFDEIWIAHGAFNGTFDGAAASASFSYVASVRAGGAVEGTIVLAGGLTGALGVNGNFVDGRLSYDGRVRR